MYERLKDLINTSTSTVVLVGSPLIEECGGSYIRDQDRSYDIEDDYGYAPEELFSDVMLSTRPDVFFKYYKKEVINKELVPSATFSALAELENRGKMVGIITRCIYGFAGEAGVKNIIALRGSVLKNRCRKCGAEYPISHIKEAKGIPQCTKCASVIRPEVVLNGEMMNNQKMTMAADLIGAADVLLILGTNLRSDLVQNLIQYYKGDKLIIINKDEDFTDNLANVVIHERPMDVLPKIL